MKVSSIALNAALFAVAAPTSIASETSTPVSSQTLKPVSIVPYELDSGCNETCQASCGDVRDAKQCFSKGWVYCDNAVCSTEPTTEANGKSYGGVPFVTCQCWQPTNSDYSIVPDPNTGAGCVLGLDNFGGNNMCDEIAGGQLISTYGPFGTQRQGSTPDEFAVKTAICKPRTPWAWCWGAPCVEDPGSPTGITCHCPYMSTDNNKPQRISLAGEQACNGNPCEDGIWNSMPSGTSPNAVNPDSSVCFNYDGTQPVSKDTSTGQVTALGWTVAVIFATSFTFII